MPGQATTVACLFLDFRAYGSDHVKYFWTAQAVGHKYLYPALFQHPIIKITVDFQVERFTTMSAFCFDCEG